MKCSICGKELKSPQPFKKLNVCPFCYEQLSYLTDLPNDGWVKKAAQSYFSSLSKTAQDVAFHDVYIPITDEYAKENPDYYDAFLNDASHSIKQSNSQNIQENMLKDCKDDIHQMKESLANIERYTRLFYVLAIICLILSGICVVACLR